MSTGFLFVEPFLCYQLSNEGIKTMQCRCYIYCRDRIIEKARNISLNTKHQLIIIFCHNHVFFRVCVYVYVVFVFILWLFFSFISIFFVLINNHFVRRLLKYKYIIFDLWVCKYRCLCKNTCNKWTKCYFFSSSLAFQSNSIIS